MKNSFRWKTLLTRRGTRTEAATRNLQPFKFRQRALHFNMFLSNYYCSGSSQLILWLVGGIWPAWILQTCANKMDPWKNIKNIKNNSFIYCLYIQFPRKNKRNRQPVYLTDAKPFLREWFYNSKFKAWKTRKEISGLIIICAFVHAKVDLIVLFYIVSLSSFWLGLFF